MQCEGCRYVCTIEIIFSFQFYVLVSHLAIDEDIPNYIHNLVIAIYLTHILKSLCMSAQLTVRNQQQFSSNYLKINQNHSDGLNLFYIVRSVAFVYFSD